MNMFKLGYGGWEMNMPLTDAKNRQPKAHTEFENELG
jgi:hypothetical protein